MTGLHDQLRKLELRDGDVICLPADTLEKHIQQLSKTVRELHPGKRLMFVLGDIQALDEAAMKAAGWYRK
nr:hypothetical protein [Pseudomonas toyotomiensis]